jgi:putative intracellular protease/amidase
VEPAAGDPADVDGEAAYPITGLGYAVLTDRPSPAAVRFVRWAVTAGQPLAGPTGYAPLPPRLADEAADRLSGLVT